MLKAVSNTMNPDDFHNFLAKSLNAFDIWTNSREYALDFGIDEQALERYISRACCVDEESTIQGLLLRNSWSLHFLIQKIENTRS